MQNITLVWSKNITANNLKLNALTDEFSYDVYHDINYYTKFNFIKPI
jgi:hypothetical protein